MSFAGVSDEAVAVVLAALLCKEVQLTMLDGSVYEGLFGGTERPNNKHPTLHISLRFARLVTTPVNPQKHSAVTIIEQRGRSARRVLIPIPSVSTMVATPIDFASLAPQTNKHTDNSATRRQNFATDAEISKGTSGTGRQLQRFEQFTDLTVPPPQPTPAVSSNLDEQTFGEIANTTLPSGRKWDQFQANESKFGVTTSFDEDQYTTKIDRKGADFEERERMAARLAEEIESSNSDNVHVREERNQSVGDDYDEEERFSGVQRPRSAQVDSRPLNDVQPKPVRPQSDRPRLSYAAAAAAGNTRTIPQKPSAPAKPAQPAKTTAPPSKPSSSTEQPNSAKPASQSAAQSSAKTLPPPKSASTAKPAPPSKLQANGKTSTHSKPAPTAKAAPSVTSVNANASPAPSATNRTVPAKSAPSKAAQSSNKDKEVPEKNGKVPITKDRSSRENLPPIMKVRTSLQGMTPPNPSRNSPLLTPVAPDTNAIGVLNLDAQTPNLGPEQIKKFEEYKANREMQSIAANREKITDDLKKFSTQLDSQLDSRNGPMRRGLSAGSSSAGSSSANANPAPSALEEKAADVVKKEVTKKEVTKKEATKKEQATKNVSKKEVAKKEVIPKEITPKDVSKKEVASPVVAEPQNKLNNEGKPLVATKAVAENAVQGTGDAAAKKASESAIEGKSKTKPKSKLNPNAAEFKMPAPRKPAMPVPAPQQPYNAPTYGPASGGMEMSQPMPTMPQGYPMPMQPVPQFPYGQPYTMMVPAAAVPGTMPAGGGIQYMQGPAVSFPVGQVPGRFPQSMGMPVSYGYPPVTPMVIAQPAQRIPSGPPYQFYNAPAPFGGAQGGGSPISPPLQQPVYPPHGGGPHNGGMHMPGGGMAMGGRGGHNGNNRRGGMGRPRGRQHGHHMSQHNGQMGQGPNLAGGNVERGGQRSPEVGSGGGVDEGAQR